LAIAAAAPLLAYERQLVGIFSADAFKCRDGVGADALVRLRMPGTEPQIARVHHQRAVAAPRRHRHLFSAAGDHEILCTGHDRGRSHVDAGNARAAEAIERNAARPDVIACVQRRHPADVAGLLANLGAGAPNDVVDLGGVDAGALAKRAQNGRPEVLWVDVRERALAGLADAARRSARIDNQCIHHVPVLCSEVIVFCSAINVASCGWPRQGAHPRR